MQHDVVAAYATLSMTGIDRSAAPAKLAKGAPNPVPALLLGRLAVDRRHAGLGLGTALVAHVPRDCRGAQPGARVQGGRGNTLNEAVRQWWHRLGFKSFEPTNPDSLDLYLLASDIETTLRTVR